MARLGVMARAAGLACALAGGVASAEPFTYQGKLDDSGLGAPPATYEMEFRVFDDQAIGAPDNQVGLTLSFTGGSAVPVTNGLFTTTLEFGPLVFTGPARYLEVRVRRPGGGAYTTLPRQAITPSPQAVYATTAGALRLPAYLVGPPYTPSGATLWITNDTAGGGAIQGVGTTWGVVGWGGTLSSYFGAVSGTGVYGIGQNMGVAGTSNTGTGVYGVSTTGNAGYFELPSASSTSNALEATTAGAGRAARFTRTSSASASPVVEIGGPGADMDVLRVTMVGAPGSSGSAVRGIIDSASIAGAGVFGSHTGGGSGVLGQSASGQGVWGDTVSGTGVIGFSSSGTGGEFHHTNATGTNPGVYGATGSGDASAIGVRGAVLPAVAGSFSAGVRGENNGTGGNGIGVFGSQAGSGWGVYGTTPSGVGVRGQSTTGTGVQGISTSGLAGQFQGNVSIIGNLTVSGSVSKGSGSFRIDHPQDPENKFLVHSFVESPEMKNVYDGVAALDSSGEATVVLPSYFEALNGEFRYQLTCVGGYAPVYIAQEVKENRFRIAGGRAGLKVSWQVTGVRHDAYALKHPIVPEVRKSEAERGRFVAPEAYGLPAERAIGIPGPTEQTGHN